MSSPRRVPLTDLVGALAIVAITLGLYAAVVRPLASHRASLHARRAELASLRADAERFQVRRTAAQQRRAVLRAELDALPVRLEPMDRLNAAIARIVTLASECGLQIHESSAGDAVHGERHDSVPIGLSGRGRFPACVEFLRRGSAALADVDVTGFRLAGSPALPEAGAAFEFDLEWFAVAAAGAPEP